MSGKSVTTLIPVSTVVHTTAGTETTFQRLAAGDLLKLLIVTSEDGEEVIIEIWMQCWIWSRRSARSQKQKV